MSLGVGGSPDWFKSFKWGDLFGGIKKDIVKGAKTLQSGTKAVLGGLTSTLTPTLIWLVVLAIVGLFLYAWLRKLMKV